MYLKQYEVESRVEFFKGDIQEIIKSHKTIKKWAYILHDKDDTAPHYHIYLNFGNSGVDSKQVAEWFGLQESQVNKVRGRATDMLLYLTHGNDSQKNKYQYSPTEVVANFDFETEIKNSKILGDFEKYSYAQQLEYVHSLPVSEQSGAFRNLENLWRMQCKWLSLQTDRNIDVVFICGKGGTGKTYYAKKLLKSLGYDFCISSSSNDPFQDYLGQKGIILDDLRDRVFENFEDLLKILDNNTMSSVASRFNNKVFNGKMIVITSSVPLIYWYKGRNSKGNFFNIGNEDLIQLYRRIGCYVVMTKEEIIIYEQIDSEGRPKGLGKVYKNELAAIEEKPKEKTDFGALFDGICECATSSPFDGQPQQLKFKV
ncbi:MAG: hypothetical protein LUI60_02110 [Clostridia bacterium]|nr:hypothetical protein [Clostridia bacterium]